MVLVSLAFHVFYLKKQKNNGFSDFKFFKIWKTVTNLIASIINSSYSEPLKSNKNFQVFIFSNKKASKLNHFYKTLAPQLKKQNFLAFILFYFSSSFPSHFSKQQQQQHCREKEEKLLIKQQKFPQMPNVAKSLIRNSQNETLFLPAIHHLNTVNVLLLCCENSWGDLINYVKHSQVNVCVWLFKSISFPSFFLFLCMTCALWGSCKWMEVFTSMDILVLNKFSHYIRFFLIMQMNRKLFFFVSLVEDYFCLFCGQGESFSVLLTKIETFSYEI